MFSAYICKTMYIGWCKISAIHHSSVNQAVDQHIKKCKLSYWPAPALVIMIVIARVIVAVLVRHY